MNIEQKINGLWLLFYISAGVIVLSVVFTKEMVLPLFGNLPAFSLLLYILPLYPVLFVVGFKVKRLKRYRKEHNLYTDNSQIIDDIISENSTIKCRYGMCLLSYRQCDICKNKIKDTMEHFKSCDRNIYEKLQELKS